MLGQQPLPPGGRGCLWLMGVQCWDRKGLQVWLRGLHVSSVPVLLHSCLRCLHCFPLHPDRLVLSLSRVSGGSGPQEGGENGKTALGATSFCFLNLSPWALSLVRSERWKEAEALACGWRSGALISSVRE